MAAVGGAEADEVFLLSDSASASGISLEELAQLVWLMLLEKGHGPSLPAATAGGNEVDQVFAYWE